MLSFCEFTSRFFKLDLKSCLAGIGAFLHFVGRMVLALLRGLGGLVFGLVNGLWLLITDRTKFRTKAREFRAKVLECAAGFSRYWNTIKDGWAVVRPAWFAALISVGVTIALQNGQALDALNTAAGATFVDRLILFACVLAVAFTTWYFPRALLYVNYPRITPLQPEKFEVLRRWVPRALGLLPILSVAWAYLVHGPQFYGVVYFLTALVCLCVLIVRRVWLDNTAPATFHDKMPKESFKLAIGLQVLSVIGLLAFLISKVLVPQAIGPLGILLLAAAMWCSGQVKTDTQLSTNAFFS